MRALSEILTQQMNFYSLFYVSVSDQTHNGKEKKICCNVLMQSATFIIGEFSMLSDLSGHTK